MATGKGGELGAELARLGEWLRRDGAAPGWSAVRVVENSRRLRFEAGAGGGWRIPRGELLTPEAFAPRFEELLRSGYSWIELEALGILEDTLLVMVLLPREETGVPPGGTAVLLAGPTWRPGTRDSREVIWDAGELVRVEG